MCLMDDFAVGVYELKKHLCKTTQLHEHVCNEKKNSNVWKNRQKKMVQWVPRFHRKFIEIGYEVYISLATLMNTYIAV